MHNLIPCVGFELQYSPLQRDSVENFANSLHSNTSEFVFDVFQSVEVGKDILMLFSNKQEPTQQILAEVLTCIRLEDEHYRLTLKIRPDSRILIDKVDLICLPIIKGPSTAQQMTLECPSCSSISPFRFIATQEGDWDNGILPIYNCAACGTTRAMIGLLNDNAQLSDSSS
jgi:DNA-directed RNA polymerase subunit RPC12/RpoP